MRESPFIVGAKVAIQISLGWRAPVWFKAATVAKVLKNGNFTLEGSAQQWKPHGPSNNSSYENFWRAGETGAGNRTLRIWDDAASAEIIEKNTNAVRYKKFEAARAVIDREQFSELVTDEVIEHMETIVAAIKPKKESVA